MKKYAKRDEVVLASKVHGQMSKHPNGGGLSRKHIYDQLDASLRRLQTDYIDLYQIHRWDYETPIEETLEALHDAIKMGKVRYIGAPSYVCLAIRGGALYGGFKRPPALYLDAESLQPRLS